MSDISYLDRAAASAPGRAYKRSLRAALRLRPGHTVLDVGCGPATDLVELARSVGDGGRVLGVDRDPVMVAEAVRRTADHPGVAICTADAHALPLRRASVDRARVDRVLMHVAEPTTVLAELHRVLRPGGLVTLAEPDWDTLVIDADDVATSRAYTRYVATRVVRHAAIGRQLPRLAAAAGLTPRAVRATPILFTERGAADEILRPASVLGRAVDDGAIDAVAAGAWLANLDRGPFLAAFTLFTVLARRPG